MKRFVLAVTMLLTACSGVEEACTLIGCTDGWTLRLETPGANFAPGVYALTTTVDGTATTCSWEVRLACDGGGACVVDGDCANTVYTATEIAVSFDTTPAAVEVSITRGGLQIVSESLAPSYTETRPNGPDCDPVCRQAVETLTVP